VTRQRGQHGPPRSYQQLLLNIAHQIGMEGSDQELLERLLKNSPTRRAQQQQAARSRRFFWEEDAFRTYRDLIEGEVKEWRTLPDEIFETPIPPKRRKYAAEVVATWAFRHRRQGVEYTTLAGEAVKLGVSVAEKDVNRAVNRNQRIWELADEYQPTAFELRLNESKNS
jgi:hypothetical protein